MLLVFRFVSGFSRENSQVLQQRSLVRIVRRSIRSSDLVVHKIEWKVGASSDVEDMIARQSRA